MEICQEILDRIFIINGHQSEGDYEIEIDDYKIFDNNEDNVTITFIQYIGALKTGGKYDIKYTTKFKSLETCLFLDRECEYVEEDLVLQIENLFTPADGIMFNTYIFKKETNKSSVDSSLSVLKRKIKDLTEMTESFYSLIEYKLEKKLDK